MKLKESIPLLIFLVLSLVFLWGCSTLKDNTRIAAGGASGPSLPGRNTSPLVSSEWLMNNASRPEIIILDLRAPEDYAKGHIPGSLSIPAGSFVTLKNDLLLELPEEDELFHLIGSAGIKKDSHVILVHTAGHTYPLADATRAAFTLIYSGVREVSILNGGIEAWKRNGMSLSLDPEAAVKVSFASEVYPGMVVRKDYVKGRIGKSLIVDARDPSVYFGTVIEPFAPRPGHIPSAVSIPTPWIWTEEGTYRTKNELAAMMEYILGYDKEREIIVYCGVGGYGSSAWFVQHDILGYTNVKLYDGSAQEWVMDPESPMVLFRWE